MTKPPSRFVPSAAASVLLAVVLGSAVCAWQRQRLHSEQVVAPPTAVVPATVATPLRERRSEAESEAQIDGMSFGAENRLVQRTDFYFHHGDYPRIIALDKIITEIDPQDVDTYSTGGWLMESDGDNADAQAYYSLGMARNPESSDAAFALAMFYYGTLHNYPAAEAVLTRSVHTPGAGVLDWKLLAHTYEQELRYDQAVATWKLILRDYPTAPAIVPNLRRDESLLALQQSANARKSAGRQSPPASAPVQPANAGVK